MESKAVTFNFSARYFVIGTPSAKTKYVWFVCHGYGQLATYFIRKFELLNDGQHVIVAPEGLSRFYLKGFSGKVGATWMTKEDRTTDIINYCTYLDALGATILQQVPEGAKITLFGFSQGGMTASRWLTESKLKFDRLILWGSGLAKDINITAAQAKLSATAIYLVTGSDDPFLTTEIMEEQTLLFQQLGVQYEKIMFEGGHEINEDALKYFLPK